jgi:hypothetical protein
MYGWEGQPGRKVYNDERGRLSKNILEPQSPWDYLESISALVLRALEICNKYINYGVVHSALDGLTLHMAACG